MFHPADGENSGASLGVSVMRNGLTEPGHTGVIMLIHKKSRSTSLIPIRSTDPPDLLALFPHYFSEEVVPSAVRRTQRPPRIVLRKNSGASLGGSVMRNGISRLQLHATHTIRRSPNTDSICVALARPLKKPSQGQLSFLDQPACALAEPEPALVGRAFDQAVRCSSALGRVLSSLCGHRRPITGPPNLLAASFLLASLHQAYYICSPS